METLAQQWPLLAALVALITPILMFIVRLYERIIADLKAQIIEEKANRDRFLNMALDMDNQAETATRVGEQVAHLRHSARR